MKINPQRKTSRKTVAAISIAVLLVLALGGYYLWASGKLGNSNVKNGVDYSPATETDKELNDDIKKSLPTEKETEEADSSEPDTAKTPVMPVISAWGQPGGTGTDLQVNGYVPEVIESDGTCTITLTKDGNTATVSKASLQNAQNTSCGQLIIPYAQLSTGTWQAVLSYSSSASAGSSTKTQIEVR